MAGTITSELQGHDTADGSSGVGGGTPRVGEAAVLCGHPQGELCTQVAVGWARRAAEQGAGEWWGTVRCRGLVLEGGWSLLRTISWGREEEQGGSVKEADMTKVTTRKRTRKARRGSVDEPPEGVFCRSR